MVPKRLSDFPSDFVKHSCARLGIVAASARREALGLAGCRSVRLHGVLGVECSNHSVPTILFKGLRDFISRPFFIFKCFYPYKTTGFGWNPRLFQRKWARDFRVPESPRSKFGDGGRGDLNYGPSAVSSFVFGGGATEKPQ